MKNGKRISLSIIAVLFFCTTAGAGVAADSAGQAEVFFHNQQYKEALGIWHQMAERGDVSAGTYFNIGMAESRLNNVPAAMLAYEKALRLQPGNMLIKNAIVAERKRIEDATIPVEPFFMSNWYTSFLALMRPGYWALLGLFFLIGGLIHFLLKLKRQPASTTGFNRVPILVCTTGVLLMLVGLLSYLEIYSENEAIINAQCEIRQAPADDSPIARILSPGEKVTITDHIGNWRKISLLNLDEGWIKTECMIPIRMGKE